MPVVSVIIPFFRNREWLVEALESVFSQSFKDYEVILINDGSPEDISDIINKYNNIVYRKQNNQGPAAARNLGISLAKGKYIAFEDSDDIWLPTKLEKQISFMEKTGAKWSHTGFYFWWPNSNRTIIADNCKDYGDIYLQRLVSVKMATPSVVIEKSLLDKEKLIFPVNIRNGEDGALYTQISKKYPVALVQEPLVKVRMRGSNSNTHAIERFRLNAHSYKVMKKHPEDYSSVIIFIKGIYYLYSKSFNGKETKLKEFLAKIFWFFPYTIERIYVRYLQNFTKKDGNLILRWEKK